MPQTIGAAIFDFDGTLAELTIDFQAMRRKVAALAEAFLDEPVAADDTSPVLEWVQELAQEVGRREGHDLSLEFASRCRLAIVDMEVRAAGQGRLFPFARPLLASLRQAGVRTAIVTRNCGAAVRLVHPQVLEDVDCLLTRDDVQRVKPDPAHLLAALQRVDVAPERGLMVGDHPLDVVAGKAAGTRTAAVASGRTSLEELARGRPDFLANNCRELFDTLESTGQLAG